MYDFHRVISFWVFLLFGFNRFVCPFAVAVPMCIFSPSGYHAPNKLELRVDQHTGFRVVKQSS